MSCSVMWSASGTCGAIKSVAVLISDQTGRERAVGFELRAGILAERLQGFDDLRKEFAQFPGAGVKIGGGVFLAKGRGGQPDHGGSAAALLEGLHDGPIGRRGGAVRLVNQDEPDAPLEILDDFRGALYAFL